MVLSILPVQSLSRYSFDKVSVITWVSTSLGPAGMSAGFGDMTFNCEGEDTIVVVLLRGVFHNATSRVMCEIY